MTISLFKVISYFCSWALFKRENASPFGPIFLWAPQNSAKIASLSRFLLLVPLWGHIQCQVSLIQSSPWWNDDAYPHLLVCCGVPYCVLCLWLLHYHSIITLQWLYSQLPKVDYLPLVHLAKKNFLLEKMLCLLFWDISYLKH